MLNHFCSWEVDSCTRCFFRYRSLFDASGFHLKNGGVEDKPLLLFVATFGVTLLHGVQLAEVEGFEPSSDFSASGFQDRPLNPLGYTSIDRANSANEPNTV